MKKWAYHLCLYDSYITEYWIRVRYYVRHDSDQFHLISKEIIWLNCTSRSHRIMVRFLQQFQLQRQVQHPWRALTCVLPLPLPLSPPRQCPPVRSPRTLTHCPSTNGTSPLKLEYYALNYKPFNHKQDTAG